MSVISSTRAMTDRMRQYDIEPTLTPAQQSELATKVRFGIGMGGRR